MVPLDDRWAYILTLRSSRDMALPVYRLVCLMWQLSPIDHVVLKQWYFGIMFEVNPFNKRVRRINQFNPNLNPLTLSRVFFGLTGRVRMTPLFLIFQTKFTKGSIYTLFCYRVPANLNIRSYKLWILPNAFLAFVWIIFMKYFLAILWL